MPKPRAAVLSGVATTRVGELPGSSCLALHAEAAQLALTDAGLALQQIDVDHVPIVGSGPRPVNLRRVRHNALQEASNR